MQTNKHNSNNTQIERERERARKKRTKNKEQIFYIIHDYFDLSRPIKSAATKFFKCFLRSGVFIPLPAKAQMKRRKTTTTQNCNKNPYTEQATRAGDKHRHTTINSIEMMDKRFYRTKGVNSISCRLLKTLLHALYVHDTRANFHK